MLLANSLPGDVVRDMVEKAHNGTCPVCREQRGPVDVHNAHKIASFVIFSTWSSSPQISRSPPPTFFFRWPLERGIGDSRVEFIH